MERPDGIRFTQLLLCGVGIFALLVMSLLVVGGVATRGQSGGWFNGLTSAIFFVIALPSGGLGILAVATGVSLGRRKSWARISAIILAVGMCLIGTLTMFALYKFPFLAFVGLALAGLGALCLSQLHQWQVKQWFSPEPSEDQAAR